MLGVGRGLSRFHVEHRCLHPALDDFSFQVPAEHGGTRSTLNNACGTVLESQPTKIAPANPMPIDICRVMFHVEQKVIHRWFEKRGCFT
jgi:hypothetical protein